MCDFRFSMTSHLSVALWINKMTIYSEVQWTIEAIIELVNVANNRIDASYVDGFGH